LIGFWHAVWAALVAFGFAQPIVDFIFWMHFIKPVYTIGPFNIGTALVLIAVTSIRVCNGSGPCGHLEISSRNKKQEQKQG
jgi:hypothetical protein